MKTRQLSVLLTSIALLSLLFTSFAAAETNEGQTFTVTATTDVVDALPGDGVCETAPGNGMCTLRAAIMEANALIGADTILLPEADYELTIPGAGEDESATGDLDITDELTILGAENTWSSIFATGLGDRVLDIIFSAGSVSVTWITLSGGEETYGGGIRSYAALELTHVNIFQNDAAWWRNMQHADVGPC
jgi:CSLREA domain-containing protein